MLGHCHILTCMPVMRKSCLVLPIESCRWLKSNLNMTLRCVRWSIIIILISLRVLIQLKNRGQYFGFIVALIVAVMAAGLAYLGHDGIAISFVAAMASVAAVFALRKWPKDKNNENVN